jgi:cilia- and flagella-associated protein 69
VNASVLDEEYKLKISDVGVIDVLLDLIGSETESIEIKELCYSIISNLCQGCNKNKKQFRSKGGVDYIIQSLKNPDIITSERNSLYTLSVLDCLWNSVLGNKKSESLFLDNEVDYSDIRDSMY